MINCQESREFLSIKLDGELNKLELKELTEHLSSCLSCQEYEQRLDNLHQDILSLREVPLEESIVDKLFEKNPFMVEEKKEPKATNGRRWKSWYSLATAAVFIILIIPIVSMLNSNENPSEANFKMAQMDAANESSSLKSVDGDRLGIASTAEGAYGENTDKGNDFNTLTVEPTTQELEADYTAVEEDNQLVIYQADKEIYRTVKWERDVKVEWEKPIKNEVIYFLSKNGKQVGKYKINLNELKEEKIN